MWTDQPKAQPLSEANGRASLPYPIFLELFPNGPNNLKNSDKSHFNPLRIENLAAPGESLGNF